MKILILPAVEALGEINLRFSVSANWSVNRPEE